MNPHQVFCRKTGQLVTPEKWEGVTGPVDYYKCPVCPEWWRAKKGEYPPHFVEVRD